MCHEHHTFYIAFPAMIENERAVDTIIFSFLLVATLNKSTEGGVKLMIHLFIIILI